MRDTYARTRSHIPTCARTHTHPHTHAPPHTPKLTKHKLTTSVCSVMTFSAFQPTPTSNMSTFSFTTAKVNNTWTSVFSRRFHTCCPDSFKSNTDTSTGENTSLLQEYHSSRGQIYSPFVFQLSAYHIQVPTMLWKWNTTIFCKMSLQNKHSDLFHNLNCELEFDFGLIISS